MAITPTAAPLATQFFARGNVSCIFVLSMANYKAPTEAEITAGVDITEDIMDMAGWSSATTFIGLPSLATTFDGKLAGADTAADSTLTMYSDQDGDDASTVFTQGQTGFMCFLDKGLDSTIADIFPCQVGALPKARSMTTAVTMVISFGILRKPAERVAITAA